MSAALMAAKGGHGLPLGVADLLLDENSTDNFLMHCYKVVPCGKRYRHDWSVCPFAHQGEMAARRDPSKYVPVFCTHAKQRIPCPKGDDCPHAHNLFEMHLHPLRYRTELCQFGPNCNRPVCFFAHTPEQLRVTGYSGNLGAPNSLHTSSLGLQQQLVMMQLQQMSGAATPTLAAAAAAAGSGGLARAASGHQQHLDSLALAAGLGRQPSHSGPLTHLPGSLHGLAHAHSGGLPVMGGMAGGALQQIGSGVPLSAPLQAVNDDALLQQLMQQQQQHQHAQQQWAQAQQQYADLQQLLKDAAAGDAAAAAAVAGRGGRLSPTTPLLSPTTPGPYLGSPASSTTASRAASGLQEEMGDGLALLQAQLAAGVTLADMPVSVGLPIPGPAGPGPMQAGGPDMVTSEGLLAALAQQLGVGGSASAAMAAGGVYGGAALSMPLPQAHLAGLMGAGGAAPRPSTEVGASSADPLVTMRGALKPGGGSGPGSPTGGCTKEGGQAPGAAKLPAPVNGMGGANSVLLQLAPFNHEEREPAADAAPASRDQDAIPAPVDEPPIGQAEAARLLASLPASKVAELLKHLGTR